MFNIYLQNNIYSLYAILGQLSTVQPCTVLHIYLDDIKAKERQTKY